MIPRHRKYIEIINGDIQDPDPKFNKKSTDLNTTFEESKNDQSSYSLNKLNRNNDIEIPLFKHRYWRTWKIFRPPLSSHWSEWNHCVKGFDHHWGVINAWIAVRNIRNFAYMYLSGWISGIVFTIGTLLYYKHIIENNISSDQVEYIKDNKILFIGSILLGIIGGLSTYVGAAPWMILGFIGIGYSWYLMNKAISALNCFSINIYPLTVLNKSTYHQ